MSRQLMSCIAGGTALFISLVLSVPTATAAETGTKTFPGSSTRAPATSDWIYESGPRYGCYLPSDFCDNEHRVEN